MLLGNGFKFFPAALFFPVDPSPTDGRGLFCRLEAVTFGITFF